MFPKEFHRMKKFDFFNVTSDLGPTQDERECRRDGEPDGLATEHGDVGAVKK